MSLTDAELRSLEQISTSLRHSDPRLARTLTCGRARLRTLDAVTLLVLLTTLVVGVACRLPVVCAVGWTAVIAISMVRGIFADRY